MSGATTPRFPAVALGTVIAPPETVIIVPSGTTPPSVDVVAAGKVYVLLDAILYGLADVPDPVMATLLPAAISPLIVDTVAADPDAFPVKFPVKEPVTFPVTLPVTLPIRLPENVGAVAVPVNVGEASGAAPVTCPTL